jgi:hypothetical protein
MDMDIPTDKSDGENPPSSLNVSARSWLITAFFWAIFGFGILLQAFSAHLEVKGNAFVMPPDAKVASGLSPRQIVNRERRLQSVSMLLVLGGALALSYRYRHYLIESFRLPRRSRRS